MKDIHFVIGLPRTGSTTLTAVLDQNPTFYATGTTPVPSIVESIVKNMGPQSDFTSTYHKDLKKRFYGMLEGAIRGWHEAETDKPVVFSKGRPWIMFYDELKTLYPNAKFIFCVRDLRAIILSFEKLLPEFPYLRFSLPEYQEITPHRLNQKDRIEFWLKNPMSALGICLPFFPKFYDLYKKNPEDFITIRYEDLTKDPQTTITSLYNSLGYDRFQHDFTNLNHKIKEYDSAYWSYVDHTVGKEIVYREPDYSILGGHNQEIVDDNIEFYKLFYPEIFRHTSKRSRF